MFVRIPKREDKSGKMDTLAGISSECKRVCLYRQNEPGIGEKMSKRYVYANQKGGVTKTTTALSASIMASLCGKRTLLVDMDAQGNSTWATGYSPDYLEHTVYTAMQGTSSLRD